MNKKILFPLHLDGGNRGCEAIAKGTALILNQEFSLYGLSRDPEYDKMLGLNESYTLYKAENPNIIIRIIRKLFSIILKDKTKYYFYKILNKGFYGLSSPGDFVFSTGGDLLCYKNADFIILSNAISRKLQLKTVLWGCSVGKENLTEEKIKTLKEFAAITVRESLSFKVLQDIGLKNVYLFPDPAFVLEPEKCNFPACMEKNVVGINFSNFVNLDVSKATLIGENFYNLVKHIIQDTEYDVVLIPHVFWKGQDDRIICNEIYNMFKDSGRVKLLESDNYNYCQIRYIISKCEIFIGARTHAVISAYSMAVPTLALGYSIKSVGIAKDLGLSENLVVNCKSLSTSEDLNIAFDNVNKNKHYIKEHLQSVMPSYKDKAFLAKKILSNI